MKRFPTKPYTVGSLGNVTLQNVTPVVFTETFLSVGPQNLKVSNSGAVRAGKVGLARNTLALFKKVLGEAGAKLGKPDVIVSAGASSQSPTCSSSTLNLGGFLT